MTRRVAIRAPLVLGAFLVACAHAQPEGQPSSDAGLPYLPRSHSHNDYEHPRPLVDALERGFASIEVDVVLRDGEIYVGHGADEVEEWVTLTSLYLAPLREVVRRNQGTVYGPSRPPLQLLVDVKTDADATYLALERVLGEYSDMLTKWMDDRPESGAVSIVLSGNRALESIAAGSPRYAAIDGRILDDRGGLSPEAMPLVSADWEKLGPPVREDRLARARELVEQMHAEGRKVRFWATPEDEGLWTSLIAMGVDYIGTDDPSRLERLLLEIGVEPVRAIDD
jgi:hypothetical protein